MNKTHTDIVNAAYKWAINTPPRCGTAFKEFKAVTMFGEQPDVIGFMNIGSVLIECKVSRADFIADKKKIFRQFPNRGMGRFRFYACPSGLINENEIPENWGLIYVNEKGKARCIYNPYCLKNPIGNIWSNGFEQYNVQAEYELMYSALRRLHLRNRIEEIYEPLTTNKIERDEN